MGGRFPRSSSWQAYPFAGAVPLCLTLGTLAFGHGILFRRDSCSDGHSVVVFATFLFLDFGLCMRKEKQIQKTAHGFFRSRLCICQMKYVYYIDIRYSVQIWTHYNSNACSCQALPKKIFEGGGGQAVSDGTNAKEKLPQGPAHRGSLAEACTLLRWCKCRVKVMYKSVHT